jgi:Holliday junction resolvase-like predicted endonuclease
VIGIMLAILFSIFFKSLLFSIICLFICLVLTRFTTASDVSKAGVEGEDIALDILSQLPDNFHLFNQINIPNLKSKYGFNEADMIAVNNNTVFVIEVKHNNGNIAVSEPSNASKEWEIIKTGRAGGIYNKTMRNPIVQVKKLVNLLSKHIKQAKSQKCPWIQGVVVFTNDKVELTFVEETSIPVLKKDDLVKYLLNYESQSKNFNKSSDIVSLIASLKN